ncbi:MAG: trypsin-like peptidase domain-containing protein [Planctomycetes bacterium]|nr:trypsin-like peptidase domain-containing protein [Planctomycetota bacterium]
MISTPPGPALRARLVLALPFVLGGLLAAPAPAQTAVSAAAREAGPGIVHLAVLFTPEGAKEETAIVRPGSGILLTDDGLLLTNLHLVAEIDEDGGTRLPGARVVAVARGGFGEYEADLVARDPRLDLAVLQIHSGEGFEALSLADLGEARLGERVLAMSLAGVKNHDLFAGVLAFADGPVRLREALLDPDEVLLTDARFHDSLDGAPLLDDRGAVLGIYNASHVSALPEGFFKEDEQDPDPEPDRDYAVIVSATAIQRSLGALIAEHGLPGQRLAPPQEQESIEPVATIAPAVVSVWTGAAEEHPQHPDPSDPPARLGPDGLRSGVIVSAEGLVVTAASLFPEGTTRAHVRLADGRAFEAELLGTHEKRQVALLHLLMPAETSLPVATLTDSHQAQRGELLAVVGRPYSAPTLSVGVLSAAERNDLVQVASWMHAGHVGGAVVDRFGRLVAVAADTPEMQMKPHSFGELDPASRVDEKSFLGFATPLANVLDAFEQQLATFEPLAVVHDDEATLAARRSVAVEVATRTEHSMVNVLVSKALPQDDSFDPFADEDEKRFLLHSMGSGVIIDASGLAITNWHVVDASLDRATGAPSEDFLVEVTLPDGRRYPVDVLSTSRDDDLALISLRLNPGDTVEPVVLGDSKKLVPGQPVFAIGNPLGLANSISAGVVSELNRDSLIQGRLHKYYGLVQTDASINPGNSGGALLDAKGRLVGINSAGRSGAGMAIPVNRVRDVFSGRLISVGEMRSNYLGFEVVERDGKLVVESVDEHGPAAAAGIEVGDTLLALGDDGIEDLLTYAQVRRGLVAGADLAVRVERAGDEYGYTLVPRSYASWRLEQQSGVVLSEVPADEVAALAEPASVLLFRAYTGVDGRPVKLMQGLLRVDSARQLEENRENALRPGDLLLAISQRKRTAIGDEYDLRRLESLEEARDVIDPLVTKDGGRVECWVLRDGEVVKERLWVKRPSRDVMTK